MIDLKIGTQQRPPTPIVNTIFRCELPNSPASSFSDSDCPVTASSPLSIYCIINAGITIETIEGIKISLMTPAAVIVPAFHNMIVVTSPIGEKAPPELAEIITNAA